MLPRKVIINEVSHTEKNRGAAHFAAQGCTWVTEWAAHGNFAMQIRLPTTSIYGNSGQLSGQLSRQPTNSKYEKSGQRSGLPMGRPWAAHGNFAMQIRLPTTSIYGNSGELSGQLSRQPTTSKYEKMGSSVGSGMGCPWEFFHAN